MIEYNNNNNSFNPNSPPPYRVNPGFCGRLDTVTYYVNDHNSVWHSIPGGNITFETDKKTSELWKSQQNHVEIRPMSRRDKKLLNKSNINKNNNNKLNKKELKQIHKNTLTEYEWKEAQSIYFLHKGDVKSPIKLRPKRDNSLYSSKVELKIDTDTINKDTTNNNLIPSVIPIYDTESEYKLQQSRPFSDILTRLMSPSVKNSEKNIYDLKEDDMISVTKLKTNYVNTTKPIRYNMKTKMLSTHSDNVVLQSLVLGRSKGPLRGEKRIDYTPTESQLFDSPYSIPPDEGASGIGIYFTIN